MYTLSARGVECVHCQRGVWCVYDVSEGCGVIRRQRGVWCVDIVSEGCGVYTTSARGVV